jgi:hypothetical protein
MENVNVQLKEDTNLMVCNSISQPLGFTPSTALTTHMVNLG